MRTHKPRSSYENWLARVVVILSGYYPDPTDQALIHAEHFQWHFYRGNKPSTAVHDLLKQHRSRGRLVGYIINP